MADSTIAVVVMFTREIALARLVFVLVALMLLCLPSVALAQTGQGIISGLNRSWSRAS